MQILKIDYFHSPLAEDTVPTAPLLRGKLVYTENELKYHRLTKRKFIKQTNFMAPAPRTAEPPHFTVSLL